MRHAMTVTITFLSDEPPGQDEIDDINGIIEAITTDELQWVTEIIPGEPIGHGFVPDRPAADHDHRSPS